MAILFCPSVVRRWSWFMLLLFACSGRSPHEAADATATGGASGSPAGGGAGAGGAPEPVPGGAGHPAGAFSGNDGAAPPTSTSLDAATDQRSSTSDARGDVEVRAMLSAGCGKALAPSGERTRTLTVDGRPRSYILRVPTQRSQSTPLPVVFGFHGLGGAAEEIPGYWGRTAETEAVLVFPRGLRIPNNREGWDLSPTGYDVAFFDRMLAAIGDEYCIDLHRVFSTGFSFGGFFSNTLACARGGIVRAIASVAGGGPTDDTALAAAAPSLPQVAPNRALDCRSNVPALIVFGTKDGVVKFRSGELSRDYWLETNGCAATSAPGPTGSCISYEDCRAAVSWCVHQGGHEWPTFATDAVWSFFKAQR